MSPEKRKLATQEVRAAEPLLEEQSSESPYTLEEFSYQYFRCSLPLQRLPGGWGGSCLAMGTRRGRQPPPGGARQGQRKPGHSRPYNSPVPGRAPDKETISMATMPMARSRGHLWAYSPEPLRQPLLRSVHEKAKLRDMACQIFLDILPTSLS